jgi:endogenous inhibitor of DNA gyrase (YacG/DUF329 family)
MRGARDTRPCAACGTPLTRLLSQAKGENWYCDRRCQFSHMPPPASRSRAINPFRGQMEARPCAQCGTEVVRYISPAKLEQTWFCSRECRSGTVSRQRIADGTWKRPVKPRRGDTVPCLICGTEFYRQPAYIAQNRKLCSRACNQAWQARNQVEKTCPQCGKEFKVSQSETHLIHCSRRCEALAKIKRPTGRMHNGKPAKQDGDGYVWLWEPDHPNKSYGGWQQEHRLVAEAILGRFLYWNEHVDHVNQQKDDNRPENLQVLSPSDHAKKTNAENLGALKVLRAQIADHERAIGEQAKALAEARAKLAALESSAD